MRGLLMALISIDFPGHTASADRPRLRFTKISAKAASKTTTAKTV